MQCFFISGLYFWSFFFGLLTQWFVNIDPLYLTLLFSLIAIILIVGIISKSYRHFYGIISLFFFGMMVMHLHEHLRIKKKSFFAQVHECSGVVKDISPHTLKSWQQIYSVRLLLLDGVSPWLPYQVKITTTTLKDIQEGDLIFFEKKVNQRKQESKDFDIFLAKEGLIDWFFLNSWLIDVQKKNNEGIYSFWRWGQQNMLSSYKCLPEPARTLYGTIFLGMEKVSPLDEVRSIFNYWGINHYLARSGLHIALFIMLWKWIFQLLGISFFVRTTLLVPLVFLYVLSTPLSLSFVRGIWAFFLFLGAFYLYRPSHAQHMLYVSAFCILLYNPYALFFLDFQLSFSMTYTLFCVSSIMHNIDEKKKKQTSF